MSLFGGPEEHAANPPESWEVSKRAERLWWLAPKGADYPLETFTSKRAALAAREDGQVAREWRTEARWYAGESVPGWRPWAEVHGEHVRAALRRVELRARAEAQ